MTDYSQYYSSSGASMVEASSAAATAIDASVEVTQQRPMTPRDDGAIGLTMTPPECPVHAEAQQFVESLGIGKFRAPARDQCFCGLYPQCYPDGPDLLDEPGPTGCVAPRGWVSFGLEAPPERTLKADTSEWSSSFYGVKSTKVLSRSLGNGHVVGLGDALLDGSLLNDDGEVNSTGLWPEDPEEISTRLRAFYRKHQPENEEKAETVAEKFAGPGMRAKLDKELRRYHQSDLNQSLFLGECDGRERSVFWTSPTVECPPPKPAHLAALALSTNHKLSRPDAGLKYYAPSHPYGAGKYGDFAGEGSMAASMVLQVQQRPGSFRKGVESLGFRRLAAMEFPEWVGYTQREWQHTPLEEVEWASSEPKDAR